MRKCGLLQSDHLMKKQFFLRDFHSLTHFVLKLYFLHCFRSETSVCLASAGSGAEINEIWN